MSEVEEKYEKIVCFVDTQDENKMLKLISKDYLEIEADIYDYASYLQCNQLASDLHY